MWVRCVVSVNVYDFNVGLQNNTAISKKQKGKIGAALLTLF